MTFVSSSFLLGRWKNVARPAALLAALQVGHEEFRFIFASHCLGDLLGLAVHPSGACEKPKL